jgi:hypothetical protein
MSGNEEDAFLAVCIHRKRHVHRGEDDRVVKGNEKKSAHICLKGIR